jgi:hypothetical protein
VGKSLDAQESKDCLQESPSSQAAGSASSEMAGEELRHDHMFFAVLHFT